MTSSLRSALRAFCHECAAPLTDATPRPTIHPRQDASSSIDKSTAQEDIMTDLTQPESPDALRRRLLQAGAGIAALGLLPGALTAQAQGAFDWKRFKGQKIEVFLVKS